MPVGRKCRNFPMVRHMHTCHSLLPDPARTRTWNFIEIRTIHLCTTLGLVFQFQKCVGMGANETFYKLVHSNCRRYQCMSQKLIFWKKNFYSENTYLRKGQTAWILAKTCILLGLGLSECSILTTLTYI